MAKDPTSIKELNHVVDAIDQRITQVQSALDKSITDLKSAIDGKLDILQKVTWFACGLIGTLILAGIGIITQINGVKTDTAVLQSEMTTIKKQLSDATENIKSSMASLARIEGRLTVLPIAPATTATASDLDAPLQLSYVERNAIRYVLKAKKTGDPAKYAIGDKLSAVDPLPKDLTDALPKLRSLTWATDPSGAILIASPVARVVAIVE